ncbi:hypothetical protein MAR_009924 [Mya arenaria]|uniref:Uncharacterized protein n=1 Tax=Mya arenaria TaxID=6604 RepID=A0ABY7E335_MYAAR|nr:hypothetical protein MAR_009924 [Mya arenaria]
MSPKELRGLLLALVIVALVLLLVGFVSPGWIHIKANSGTTHIAYDYGIGTTRVLTTLTIAFSVLAVIMNVVNYLVNKKSTQEKDKPTKVAAVLATLLAGIMAIVPLQSYIDFNRRYITISAADDNDSPIYFPYSLFIFGIGFLLLLVANLISFVNIAKHYFQGNENTSHFENLHNIQQETRLS